MAPSPQTNLPQGFSVYQSALGEPLQFFPNLGTQQLDDLISSFLPGPTSIKDKRIAVTVDFFEHALTTGQNFKFYPVHAVTMASPMSASPSLDSSLEASPVTPSWDWTTSASTSPASSSSWQHTKVNSTPGRATDFSKLPGMKILTKDGRDVTNLASRGSKTKAQRDHAHLMRIIKACDDCRRRKVRCDPSHRKQSAAQTAQSPVSPGSESSKKRSRPSPTQPTLSPARQKENPLPGEHVMLVDELMSSTTSSFDFDSLLSFSDADAMESFPAAAPTDWDPFVQFSPMDVGQDANFFPDLENCISPSSLSMSHSEGLQPQWQHVQHGVGAHLAAADSLDIPDNSPGDSFLGHSGSTSEDDDFSLFLSSSQFAEDAHRLPVGSSAPLSRPKLPECPPPSQDVFSGDFVGGWEPAPFEEPLQLNAGTSVGGERYSPDLDDGGAMSHPGLNSTSSKAESVADRDVIRHANVLNVLRRDVFSSRTQNNVGPRHALSPSRLRLTVLKQHSSNHVPASSLTRPPTKVRLPLVKYMISQLTQQQELPDSLVSHPILASRNSNVRPLVSLNSSPRLTCDKNPQPSSITSDHLSISTTSIPGHYLPPSNVGKQDPYQREPSLTWPKAGHSQFVLSHQTQQCEGASVHRFALSELPQISRGERLAESHAPLLSRTRTALQETAANMAAVASTSTKPTGSNTHSPANSPDTLHAHVGALQSATGGYVSEEIDCRVNNMQQSDVLDGAVAVSTSSHQQRSPALSPAHSPDSAHAQLGALQSVESRYASSDIDRGARRVQQSNGADVSVGESKPSIPLTSAAKSSESSHSHVGVLRSESPRCPAVNVESAADNSGDSQRRNEERTSFPVASPQPMPGDSSIAGFNWVPLLPVDNSVTSNRSNPQGLEESMRHRQKASILTLATIKAIVFMVEFAALLLSLHSAIISTCSGFGNVFGMASNATNTASKPKMALRPLTAPKCSVTFRTKRTLSSRMSWTARCTNTTQKGPRYQPTWSSRFPLSKITWHQPVKF
ncbi:hypothetical protein DCS_03986 [Drechmeria coniospora]|uniref:Zn(2)-C6 fungal-type domain-containing protein n=1 Tax=Drechmeria coniospora TaxID=98403 RepID=A0A151GIS2_DRECN|nr:hypothetical protein DCS_03986 [Drechmeria coniospora]KYK56979.1 hypothetical protein DCS_03986 [Drechmeria coniospora]